MIEFIFTLLIFFGLGIVGVFFLAVTLQKKMSKDHEENEKREKEAKEKKPPEA